MSEDAHKLPASAVHYVFGGKRIVKTAKAVRTGYLEVEFHTGLVLFAEERMVQFVMNHESINRGASGHRDG
jgi:hypothetical protein